MSSSLLYNKLASLPESLKVQVLDFIESLLNRKKKEKPNKPKFGSGKGMFKMSTDFDEPLDDFKDYMH